MTQTSGLVAHDGWICLPDGDLLRPMGRTLCNDENDQCEAHPDRAAACILFWDDGETIQHPACGECMDDFVEAP